MRSNVLHLLFSSEFGGAEKVAMDLILSSSKYADSVYVSKFGGIINILNKKQIKNILLSKITYSRLKKIIEENDIGIIHAHDFKASLLASMFNKKCKIISHIHQSPNWMSSKNLRTCAYNLSLKRYDTILVTSEEIKKSFPFATKDFLVFNNKVETPYLNSVIKDIDFLFIGRLESEKNPIQFVKFVETLSKNITLKKSVMIGAGSQHKILAEVINKSNINIDLMGFIENPYDIINRAKFLVVTSIKEGFGIAILESMQMGVPVITRRIGGITDLLDDSNAIILESLVDFGRNDQLFKMIMDEKNYYELSINAKKFGDMYRNNKKWNDKLEELYLDDK